MGTVTTGTHTTAIAAQLKALRTGEDLSNRHHEELMSSTVEAEVSAGILEAHTATQREMELSMRRAAQGVYGICMDCHEPIEESRLKALPYAVHCKKCKEAQEALTARRSRR